MIQRIQTVYLFIALILTSITLIVLYNNTIIATGMAVPVLSLISIFLYRKRNIQRMLTIIAAIYLIISSIYDIYRYAHAAGSSTVLILLILSAVISAIMLLLAGKAIKKDDNLVKSYDRIR